MKTKVLIAASINKDKLYCFEEFSEALTNVRFPNKEILIVESDGDDETINIVRGFGFKCDTLNSKKKMMDKVVDARNYIREYVLDNDFDYCLMLDADSILPKDIIERLIKHEKNFTTVIQFGMDQHGGPEIVSRGMDNKPISVDKLETGLQEISVSGMGCTLLSKEVLEEIKFDCVRDPKSDKLLLGEDYCFSADAGLKGFKIWLDSDIQVKHILKGQWDFEKA